MSNKAVKAIMATGAIASGIVAGACYLTFREVIHRDAKLPGKIFAAANKKAANNGAPAVSVPDERNEWFKRQEFEEYTMLNNRGQKLKGYLLRADEPSDVYLFGSHGYRNRAMGEFNYMAKFYHDKGVNIFLVDHQAAGESEGTYIGFGYYEYRDCMCWLDYMTEHFGKDIQIILHGVSMGSATVMLMSGDENLPDNVKFTVADCGYTSAWDEFAYELKNAKVPAFPLLYGANFFNVHIAGYDFKDTDALASVGRAKLPMLFIHGADDDFVPTYMGKQLYEACSSEDKELLLVDGAEHARSYRINSEAYESKVSEFMSKYISK